MSKKGQLIRNHPSTVGRWAASDPLQDLTKATHRSGDSLPPDEEPSELASSKTEVDDGYGGGDGGDYFPPAVCLNCTYCYDNRSAIRRFFWRASPASALFCAAKPRSPVVSPITGEDLYINSMFRTPSKGLKDPDERCQDVNLFGECQLFEEPE